ncbi:LysR family transcriptional regulator [Mesorhizobium sp. J8]|uniref:LysR family transcriptional regulator n=1 Tax=Mesorhizobium sp. J8 TaxID=2777475 RepID=UPI001916AD7F|nr:LysR family transcriptional regulator [Mesorhizobium sp. J8]
MTHRCYDLAFFAALEAFEASARHLSFHRAACDLGVTVEVIGRQVKIIEEELGAPLFLEATSGMALTEAGRDLYTALASSFAVASDALIAIKRGDDGRASRPAQRMRSRASG